MTISPQPVILTPVLKLPAPTRASDDTQAIFYSRVETALTERGYSPREACRLSRRRHS
ncbi:MAG: hypothetical protein U0931_31810 [Vulcanimicrobiota bacterium]